MKHIHNLITSVVACGAVLAMVSTLCAQTAVDGTAKVVRIKGTARYSIGDTASWRPLKVGAVLKAGTIIQTDREQGTYVDLVLGDGEGAPLPTPTVANPMNPAASPPPASSSSYQPKSEQNMLRITQNTVLGIDRLTSLNTGADVVSDTQLDLKAGRILGNVKKMSAASKYEIKLPNGVAGIRGTFFDISATGEIKVLVGAVVYAFLDTNGQMVTQIVSTGQQYSSVTKVASPIPAPTVAELQAIARGLQVAAPPGFVRRTYVHDQTIWPASPVTGQ